MPMCILSNKECDGCMDCKEYECCSVCGEPLYDLSSYQQDKICRICSIELTRERETDNEN